MITTTIILFYILTIILILISIFVKDLKEVSLFAMGFLLIILSILTFTTGIQIKTGEEAISATVIEFVYTQVNDLAKIAFSGLNLAIGLALLYGAWDFRKKRIEEGY